MRWLPDHSHKFRLRAFPVTLTDPIGVRDDGSVNVFCGSLVGRTYKMGGIARCEPNTLSPFTEKRGIVFRHLSDNRCRCTFSPHSANPIPVIMSTKNIDKTRMTIQQKRPVVSAQAATSAGKWVIAFAELVEIHNRTYTNWCHLSTDAHTTPLAPVSLCSLCRDFLPSPVCRTARSWKRGDVLEERVWFCTAPVLRSLSSFFLMVTLANDAPPNPLRPAAVCQQ